MYRKKNRSSSATALLERKFAALSLSTCVSLSLYIYIYIIYLYIYLYFSLYLSIYLSFFIYLSISASTVDSTVQRAAQLVHDRHLLSMCVSITLSLFSLSHLFCLLFYFLLTQHQGIFISCRGQQHQQHSSEQLWDSLLVLSPATDECSLMLRQ